ncbi:EthD family reductase [Neobacillus pocheonensis]|uniref:EthD family reductase n=1 Tax=Neobacillus pocheonensis TaxID=363869 RepID=UPI003D2B2275
MAKIIVFYEQPKDKEGFEKYYFDVHIPLGRKIPHIKSESIQRVIQTQNSNLNFYLITELEFESLDTLNQALSSPEAKAAEADGIHLFKYLNNPPIITIIE